MALNSANTYTTGCGPQSEGSTSNGSRDYPFVVS